MEVAENETAAIGVGDATSVPPPYELVQLGINMKNDGEISKLKEAIFNGEEAERLAHLCNLVSESSQVERMVSNLSRAI